MLVLRLTLECATPLHCGGGLDGERDQPVIRDAFGNWVIPGTSLAGSLRSIADRLDSKMAERLFGWQENDAPHPSLVWCEDGLFLDFDGKPCLAKAIAGETLLFKQKDNFFIRDHVRLGLESGAAENGAKFDMEIVPAGSRFLLEIRCDGWDRRLDPGEKDFFARLCGEILAGNLTLGGKAGLGYGHYNVLESRFSEIDLFEAEGMSAWLGLEPYSMELPGKAMLPGTPAAAAAHGLDGWLEMPLECDGPILIGGGATDRKDGTASEADILFALTPRLSYAQKGGLNWLAALPGSSLRGVLRHAVHNVLISLGSRSKTAERILNDIFGYVKAESASQGKLEVEDSILDSGGQSPWQFQQHVAIDRFTGAALEGALFSEEPFWRKGAKTVLRLRVRCLAAHEAALLFHALFDLFDGTAAVGSGANRGNGRLAPHGWAENPAAALNLAKGGISWNSQPVFGNGDAAETLTSLSVEWDQSLKEKVANV